MLKATIVLVLNLPWNLMGLSAALISVPSGVRINSSKQALVFEVRSLWWAKSLFKGKKLYAITVGQVVILGKNVKPEHMKHEYIHVQQAVRAPFIHSILYTLESLRHGYKNNKYEKEAYAKQ